jgi:hypothetical protein
LEINNGLETDNIKISAKDCIGYCELNWNKPWFEEDCSELLDQGKHTKFQ